MKYDNTKGIGPYVPLYHDLLKDQKFWDLKPSARMLFIHILCEPYFSGTLALNQATWLQRRYKMGTKIGRVQGMIGAILGQYPGINGATHGHDGSLCPCQLKGFTLNRIEEKEKRKERDDDEEAAKPVVPHQQKVVVPKTLIQRKTQTQTPAPKAPEIKPIENPKPIKPPEIENPIETESLNSDSGTPPQKDVGLRSGPNIDSISEWIYRCAYKSNTNISLAPSFKDKQLFKKIDFDLFKTSDNGIGYIQAWAVACWNGFTKNDYNKQRAHSPIWIYENFKELAVGDEKCETFANFILDNLKKEQKL